MERRLAAVLIADVVGYSRLSQADEEGTRASFQADLQKVFAPKISEHHGRLVKTMGDGLLVEFRSVVDALRCAMEVQRAKAESNAAIEAGRQLAFRIGINLGDVIVEGADIHGDGVNIADRLQGLAQPGGIAVSGTAYDQVQPKMDVGFLDLGEQRVRNIDRPVRAYRVLLDPSAAGKTIRAASSGLARWRGLLALAAVVLVVAGAMGVAWLRPWGPGSEQSSVSQVALPLPEKPSIAVLPFANMSGDPGQEYFADGLTDDLITELSQVNGLFVIARNSSFSYKGKPVKIAQVAEELGVRYVLEGSVQRSGDHVRINAQLVDTLTGGHVWADRFDGSLGEIFALQDKVARKSADALAVQLSAPGRDSTVQSETSVPSAYDAFLRGWEHYRRTTAEDYAKAIPYFEEALSLDPGYSRANAALAMVYIRTFSRHWASSLGIPDNEALARARRYLSRAKERPSVLAEQAAGYDSLHRGQFTDALLHFKEAIALDPSDSWSYAYAALALASAGQPAEALPYIEVAMRLDPYPPSLFLHYRGLIQLGLGQFAEAVASLERAAELNPGDQFAFPALAAAYAHLGRQREATAAIARYNELEVAQGGVPLTLSACADLHCAIEIEQLKPGLRLAGVPDDLRHGEFAERNRLSLDEIRSLLGHPWHGRSRTTGMQRAMTSTKDGTAAMSGDWVTGIHPLAGGEVSVEGGDLCLAFAGRRSYCGPVFRNPGGTRARENEYIWYLSEPFQFSVMN